MKLWREWAKWLSLARIVAVAGLALPAEPQRHSISFELGPGEFTPGLLIPPYRTPGHGTALRAIELELEAQWTLRISVPASGVDAPLSLGLSNALVFLDCPGLQVPFLAQLPLTLSEVVSGSPGSGWEGELQTSGRQHLILDSKTVLALFSGETPPPFHIEFLARYPERISTNPEMAGSRSCASMITGRLVITYLEETLAPWASDDHLGAVLGPTFAFEVARLTANDRVGAGTWTELQVHPWTDRGLPVGRLGDLVVCNAPPGVVGSDSFAYGFQLPDGSWAGARAFFEVVESPEPADRLPSFQIHAGGLLVQASWMHSAWVAVERSDGGLAGPWTPVGTFPADIQGRVMFLDGDNMSSGSRFYRLAGY